MLSDAQIERYSRQILLPDVGGRGQERLLAARVGVAGVDEAAGLAATLVGRAGVGTLDLIGAPPVATLPPDCRVERHAAAAAPAADVVVDLGADATATALLARRTQGGGGVLVLGVRHGAKVAVATLVGRPCGVCLGPEALGDRPAGAWPAALEPPAALALGALAAAEALRALCLAPRAGRVQTLDLASGAFAVRAVGPGAGCPVCGGSA